MSLKKGRLKKNTPKQSLVIKVYNKANKKKNGKSSSNELGDHEGHGRSN